MTFYLQTLSVVHRKRAHTKITDYTNKIIRNAERNMTKVARTEWTDGAEFSPTNSSMDEPALDPTELSI